METRNAAQLNTSPSKHQFSFSKQQRFPSPSPSHSYTNAFGYEIPGFFGHLAGTGANKGFGSSQKRFVPPRNNSSTIDGPGQIDHHGDAFSRTEQFTFGVSRSNMKKLYVDEIFRKQIDNEPGPAHYEKKNSFGTTKGQHVYQVRPKNDLFVVHLEK